MTLTVTPEQAVKIASILSESSQDFSKGPQQTFAQELCQSTQHEFTTAPIGVSTSTINQQSVISTMVPTQQSNSNPQTLNNCPGSNIAPSIPLQSVPTQQIPIPVQYGVPTQVKQYTVQDLCLAARPLMEAGKQSELQALLAEFDAPSGINAIPENRRSEFAARLRAMGGQI